MAQYDESDYKVYELVGAPPILFGEFYGVAVGIHTAGLSFKAEFHTFSARPAPHLHSVAFSFTQSPESREVLTVDIPFMIEEARRQLELHLFKRLAERAAELCRPDVEWLQVELVERAGRPFVGCWIRDSFHAEIVEMASRTESKKLRSYLTAVSSLGAIEGI